MLVTIPDGMIRCRAASDSFRSEADVIVNLHIGHVVAALSGITLELLKLPCRLEQLSAQGRQITAAGGRVLDFLFQSADGEAEHVFITSERLDHILEILTAQITAFSSRLYPVTRFLDYWRGRISIAFSS
jgi:hypothetical protein